MELRPGGLCLTQAPKAEIRMLVSLHSLHVYKEKLQSDYFSIFVFYSMFWKVKCICTLLCCLYQCLNSSTARWITSHTKAPEVQCQKQIHCTWIVSCQGRIVSVWSTEGPAENQQLVCKCAWSQVLFFLISCSLASLQELSEKYEKRDKSVKLYINKSDGIGEVTSYLTKLWSVSLS